MEWQWKQNSATVCVWCTVSKCVKQYNADSLLSSHKSWKKALFRPWVGSGLIFLPARHLGEYRVSNTWLILQKTYTAKACFLFATKLCRSLSYFPWKSIDQKFFDRYWCQYNKVGFDIEKFGLSEIRVWLYLELGIYRVVLKWLKSSLQSLIIV